MAIVNRDHLPLAIPQLSRLPRPNVIVQANRDSGPGLTLSLLVLAARRRDAVVVVLPNPAAPAPSTRRDETPPWLASTAA